MAATGATHARFLLSADQLHVLESRSPHILLPAPFQTRWTPDVTPAEIAERETAAVRGLLASGLLATDAVLHPIPDDLTESINPDFGRFLSLPQLATVSIDVAAWTPERTVIQSISTLGGFALQLLRRQQVSVESSRAIARDTDAVEVTAFDIAGLAEQLLRSLDAAEPDKPGAFRPRTQVVLPMAEAEALVIALREGDPLVTARIVDRMANPDAMGVFTGIAHRVVEGFQLHALDTASGRTRSATWLRGDDGWVRLALSAPGLSPDTTPDELVESTRVLGQAVRREDIVADVLGLTAELIGGLS